MYDGYYLAHDGPARLQNALGDRRVDFGRVALEQRAAVHHRHTGEANVVLKSTNRSRESVTTYGRGAVNGTDGL